MQAFTSMHQTAALWHVPIVFDHHYNSTGRQASWWWWGGGGGTEVIQTNQKHPTSFHLDPCKETTEKDFPPPTLHWKKVITIWQLLIQRKIQSIEWQSQTVMVAIFRINLKLNHCAVCSCNEQVHACCCQRSQLMPHLDSNNVMTGRCKAQNKFWMVCKQWMRFSVFVWNQKAVVTKKVAVRWMTAGDCHGGNL